MFKKFAILALVLTAASVSPADPAVSAASTGASDPDFNYRFIE